MITYTWQGCDWIHYITLLRVYRWTRIVTRQRKNIKNKTLRQKSASPSSVAIFQHHQRMAFTFHNLYVILELVHSTVIFLTVLSYWRKSFSRKATLLPGWSHWYKNYTVVITIRFTVTKYPYLKWQWIFYFLRSCFFSPSLSRLVQDMTVYMSNVAGVL